MLRKANCKIAEPKSNKLRPNVHILLPRVGDVFHTLQISRCYTTILSSPLNSERNIHSVVSQYKTLDCPKELIAWFLKVLPNPIFL